MNSYHVDYNVIIFFFLTSLYLSLLTYKYILMRVEEATIRSSYIMRYGDMTIKKDLIGTYMGFLMSHSDRHTIQMVYQYQQEVTKRASP